jgi:hypothetical protein
MIFIKVGVMDVQIEVVVSMRSWPVAAKLFPQNPWIFQDDNATPHRSRLTTQWKQENNLPVMTWPAEPRY